MMSFSAAINYDGFINGYPQQSTVVSSFQAISHPDMTFAIDWALKTKLPIQAINHEIIHSNQQ